MSRPQISRPDGGKHIINAVVVDLGRQLFQLQIKQRQALELVFQNSAAVNDIAVTVLLFEPVCNLRPGPGRLNIAQARVEPVPAGSRIVGGQNKNLIPGLERVGQRNNAAVHPGTPAGMTNFGMHPVGKIHRRGALGQVYHMAFRRKHIHPV